MTASINQEDSCCCEPGSCVDMEQGCQCDASQLSPFGKTVINAASQNLELKLPIFYTLTAPKIPFSDGLYRPPINL